MKILIVGANGFIAKNLIVTLENILFGNDLDRSFPEETVLYKYSRSMGKEKLRDFCRDCSFVFYLAGVNRPENPDDYMEGNAVFLGRLLDELESQNNACPIMYASSIQAAQDNEYGKSKRAGEKLLKEYSERAGVSVYIYRLDNVFGKWCRPNYNSVVATFCYNIARGLPIRIDAEEKRLRLIYIDDVIEECISLLYQEKQKIAQSFIYIENFYEVTLKEIADLLYEFKDSRINKRIPNMRERSFSQRLYSTYLTYLPENQLKYSVITNQDERGSFTELFKTDERGQFSINIIKSGVTKGEHWHYTKNEKFVVVNGRGIIRLRKIGSEEIIEYPVSGEKIEVVDISPGYTHNIENVGDQDLVVVMWANENFDAKKPDTYFRKVVE